MSALPDPLPLTLPAGTRAQLVYPEAFILQGEAKRGSVDAGPHTAYYGDWRQESGVKSTLVAASLVDWDHWRSLTGEATQVERAVSCGCQGVTVGSCVYCARRAVGQ